VVAVCDVDSDRTQPAKKLAERIYRKRLGEGKVEPVKTYGDYRELVARDDRAARLLRAFATCWPRERRKMVMEKSGRGRKLPGGRRRISPSRSWSRL
jgi:hypothetical protein